MSTEGTATSASPGPPDDRQALQDEIERTREHLGETVEALVAKADVKARAQDKARQLTGRLKAKADQADVKAQAQQQARHLAGLLKSTAAQGRHRAATSLSQGAPDTVKGAADSAAATARRHRLPLAAAIGAAVASVLAWLLIRRWRR
jgi:septal ring factor EnvC (AmiA/AmiB activator)